jgi:hypothetical protein
MKLMVSLICRKTRTISWIEAVHMMRQGTSVIDYACDEPVDMPNEIILGKG